jgi:phenylacetate-CoA ligase
VPPQTGTLLTEVERSVVEGSIPQQEKYAQAGITTLNVDSVRQHATELLERNNWPRDRLAAYQQERLQHALRHAVDASPFYKETIGELVAKGAPLDGFPVLKKRELMANFDRIVTDKRLTRALIEQHLESQQAGSLLFGEYLVAATGGTSGERGVFVYNRQAWLSVTANIVRFLGILGILPNTRSIGIGAPSPIHLSNRFYAELRAGRPGAPVLESVQE